ncbi:MAG: NUDIX domain-containing protein, partial [Dokdonella sp.]
AYEDRHAILDGNVRRVLSRSHGVRGWPGDRAVQDELWTLAESHTPVARVADYTQAIMDLGATVCTRSKPRCGDCPVSGDCVALRENSVTQLPESRPRKPLPTRTTTMLICRDARQRFLLERRPPTGVWARLWSLPESDSADAAAEMMQHRLGSTRTTTTPLPDFVHTFSHFRLQISPLLVDCTTTPTAIGDNPDLAWFSPAELAHLGLPAPVRKLLTSIEETPT